jgi:hypothetical protein
MFIIISCRHSYCSSLRRALQKSTSGCKRLWKEKPGARHEGHKWHENLEWDKA